MNKFKIGDYVKSSCFDGFKKITRINNENNTINVEGLIFAHCLKDLELAYPPKAVACATPKFKVGDYVKVMYAHINLHSINRIKAIYGEDYQQLTFDNTLTIDACHCELVCNFTKGQEIELGNDYGFSARPFIFIQYRPELASPFECVINGYEKEFKNNEPYSVTHWKYARAIQPEYKAYEEPKLAWIGKPMLNKKTGKRYSIRSIAHYGEVLAIETYEGLKYTMQEMFNEWTWLDGQPCGELL